MRWSDPRKPSSSSIFEDLEPTDVFNNQTPGTIFFSNGVEIVLRTFRLSDTVDGLGGDQGIDVRSVLLDFQIAPTDLISFEFFDGERRKNIEINGDFRIFNDCLAFPDGMTVGGAAILVVPDTEQSAGTASIEGPITQFAIGGQDRSSIP